MNYKLNNSSILNLKKFKSRELKINIPIVDIEYRMFINENINYVNIYHKDFLTLSNLPIDLDVYTSDKLIGKIVYHHDTIFGPSDTGLYNRGVSINFKPNFHNIGNINSTIDISLKHFLGEYYPDQPFKISGVASNIHPIFIESTIDISGLYTSTIEDIFGKTYDVKMKLIKLGSTYVEITTDKMYFNLEITSSNDEFVIIDDTQILNVISNKENKGQKCLPNLKIVKLDNIGNSDVMDTRKVKRYVIKHSNNNQTKNYVLSDIHDFGYDITQFNMLTSELTKNWLSSLLYKNSNNIVDARENPPNSRIIKNITKNNASENQSNDKSDSIKKTVNFSINGKESMPISYSFYYDLAIFEIDSLDSLSELEIYDEPLLVGDELITTKGHKVFVEKVYLDEIVVSGTANRTGSSELLFIKDKQDKYFVAGLILHENKLIDNSSRVPITPAYIYSVSKGTPSMVALPNNIIKKCLDNSNHKFSRLPFIVQSNYDYNNKYDLFNVNSANVIITEVESIFIDNTSIGPTGKAVRGTSDAKILQIRNLNKADYTNLKIIDLSDKSNISFDVEKYTGVYFTKEELKLLGIGDEIIETLNTDKKILIDNKDVSLYGFDKNDKIGEKVKGLTDAEKNELIKKADIGLFIPLKLDNKVVLVKRGGASFNNKMMTAVAKNAKVFILGNTLNDTIKMGSIVDMNIVGVSVSSGQFESIKKQAKSNKTLTIKPENESFKKIVESFTTIEGITIDGKKIGPVGIEDNITKEGNLLKIRELNSENYTNLEIVDLTNKDNISFDVKKYAGVYFTKEELQLLGIGDEIIDTFNTDKKILIDNNDVPLYGFDKNDKIGEKVKGLTNVEKNELITQANVGLFIPFDLKNKVVIVNKDVLVNKVESIYDKQIATAFAKNAQIFILGNTKDELIVMNTKIKTDMVGITVSKSQLDDIKNGKTLTINPYIAKCTTIVKSQKLSDTYFRQYRKISINEQGEEIVGSWEEPKVSLYNSKNILGGEFEVNDIIEIEIAQVIITHENFEKNIRANILPPIRFNTIELADSINKFRITESNTVTYL